MRVAVHRHKLGLVYVVDRQACRVVHRQRVQPSALFWVQAQTAAYGSVVVGRLVLVFKVYLHLGVGLHVVHVARIVGRHVPIEVRAAFQVPQLVQPCREVQAVVCLKLVAWVCLRCEQAAVHVQQPVAGEVESLACRHQLSVFVGLEAYLQWACRVPPPYVDESACQLAILHRRYAPHNLHRLYVVGRYVAHVYAVGRVVAAVVGVGAFWHGLHVGVGAQWRAVNDEFCPEAAHGIVGVGYSHFAQARHIGHVGVWGRRHPAWQKTQQVAERRRLQVPHCRAVYDGGACQSPTLGCRYHDLIDALGRTAHLQTARSVVFYIQQGVGSLIAYVRHTQAIPAIGQSAKLEASVIASLLSGKILPVGKQLHVGIGHGLM